MSESLLVDKASNSSQRNPSAAPPWTTNSAPLALRAAARSPREWSAESVASLRRVVWGRAWPFERDDGPVAMPRSTLWGAEGLKAGLRNPATWTRASGATASAPHERRRWPTLRPGYQSPPVRRRRARARLRGTRAAQWILQGRAGPVAGPTSCLGPCHVVPPCDQANCTLHCTLAVREIEIARKSPILARFRGGAKWVLQDSNLQPTGSEPAALTD